MPVEPSHLVALASKLAVQGANEAELRAAVSRAYYAAFHALTPFVSKLPKSNSCPVGVDHVNHAELRARLKEWRTDDVCKTLKRMTATKGALWRAVEAACNARIVADYRIGHEVSLPDAQTQIARVKGVLRHVQQIANEMESSGSLSAADRG